MLGFSWKELESKLSQRQQNLDMDTLMCRQKSFKKCFVAFNILWNQDIHALSIN